MIISISEVFEHFLRRLPHMGDDSTATQIFPYFPVPTAILLDLRYGMIFVININAAKDNTTMQMGLPKNEAKLPCEMIKACRNDFSINGPRIKPMIKGVGSYSNLFMI